MWDTSRYLRDPDDCHDDMGIVHARALEDASLCTDCGLDFRFAPPRLNMRGAENLLTVPRHRFYGVSEEGWLVGGSTDLFQISLWLRIQSIDITKPYGRRPTPPSVEAAFPHGPFYVLQEVVDDLR